MNTTALKSTIRAIPLLGPALRKTWRWLNLKSPVAATLARHQMMQKDDLLAFWRTEAPEGNEPERYIRPIERSKALLDIIQFLPTDARILEVGCNVGRNLAHLRRAGYRNVEGVEISEHAIDLLRRTFPELADNRIINGAAEDVLPTLPDNSYELVFTMAVLVHIHPDSKIVFDRIGKLAPKIIAIEPTEGHSSSRHFPHNLESLFKARGFRMSKKIAWWDIPGAEREPEMSGYSAYLFDRV